MRKKLVLYKERKLLLKSDTIVALSNRFPWLVNFLMSNKDAHKEDMSTLSKEVQNYFQYHHDAVVKQASSEWEMDKQRFYIPYKKDKGIIKCELCNHELTYLCYIVNKFNQKELIVGSECINHFGMNGDIKLDTLIKDRTKLIKSTILNDAIPGIIQLHESWDRHLDNYDIMIPERFEAPYTQLGQRLNVILDKYYKSKNAAQNVFNCTVAQIKSILAEREKLLVKIAIYTQENKDKPFVVTKEIERWIGNHSNDATLHQWIHEDGFITSHTLFRIQEPSVVEKVISILDPLLRPIGYKIAGFNPPSFLITSYRDGKGQSAIEKFELSVSYPNLLSEYPEKVLSEDPKDKVFSDNDFYQIFELGTIKRFTDIVNVLESVSRRHYGRRRIKLNNIDQGDKLAYFNVMFQYSDLLGRANFDHLKKAVDNNAPLLVPVNIDLFVSRFRAEAYYLAQSSDEEYEYFIMTKGKVPMLPEDIEVFDEKELSRVWSRFKDQDQ